jgi:DNA-binding GntR family transcriptional regulator
MQSVNLRSVRPTLADLAHRHILDAIMSHQLNPGDRLRPDELALSMGISPTPVKEALARLAGEGLVDLSRATGPRVAQVLEEGIIALYECRLMCELHALREGAHLANSQFLADAARLLEAYDAAVAEDDGTLQSRKRMAEMDGAFHRHLVSLRPNPRLQAWYAQLNVHLRAHQISVVGKSHELGDRSNIFRTQHWTIHAALERGDAAAAAAAAREHVENARDWLLGLERGLPASEGL